ncbi:hypothetical protein [Thalassobellus suaedae]|uniref:Lipoprotein n=1 Tax=Thalassobellus suaedae TaxID=3074124 RepID=A0ABY9XP78_9FLAO|nr:hypothetical protein RHP51_10805 [Flavobacteriaceae bacterium HL-DH14]
MRYYLLLFTALFIFSCGKEKVIQLPEISHSDISEINDVSAAYLFYDETKKDSVELNRKNLISTTNWLVNVDKRLTLKQAIPHIQFLQEKKKNSSHKNKDAKNYYTCNDTSKKKLGFIEFTNVIYREDELTPKQNFYDQYICITAFSSDSLNLSFTTTKTNTFNMFHKKNLLKGIKSNLINNGSAIVYLILDKNLKFQDYISLKAQISNLNTKQIQIDNNEFIY